MLHIGGNRLIFLQNIVGIFTCSYGKRSFAGEESLKHSHIVEYVTQPPYRSCIVVRENGVLKVFFTSVTEASLRNKIQKIQVSRNERSAR